MAKVGFDRQTRDREHVGKKLGLYLRLRSRTVQLRDSLGTESRRAVEASKLDHAKWTGFELWKTTFDAPELDEAWDKLELIPASAFDSLDSLRRSVHSVVGWAEGRGEYEEISLMTATDL
jgi:hypothetical protein